MKFFPIAIAALALIAIAAAACSHKKAAPAAQETAADTTSVKHPDWALNGVIYEVNLRQSTDEGTVAAFAKQLPRLKDLGVDILWFMPVHPISEDGRKGTLGSYYAVRDYKAFNPEFGTIDEFKELVDSAHAMGMKVIIDWVPNHSGRDNAWVEEHPDWYALNEEGQMYGPYDWTDVYKFDYSVPEMRAGMVDAMKYWLTEVGIDGFRCDVAGEVPTDFWDEARPQLQAAQPELFMLAEASKPELQKDGFNAGYNWPMKDLFSAIAYTAGQYTFNPDAKFDTKHAVDIDTLLAQQAAKYPKGTFLMNMITNHDLNSWEGTEFERLGNLSQAFAVLSYTLPGMPLIYTGQETGMNRAFEFFEKDKAPEWEPRNEYFTFYQTLNNLKHTQPALLAGAEGAEMVRYPTDNPDIYVFSREKDGKRVIVMVNLGAEENEIIFIGKAPVTEETVNIFSGQAEAVPTSLAPGEYRVYAN